MPKGFEELDVYRLSEDMADRIWEMVTGRDTFARNTAGGHLVRAGGSRRGSYKDNCHFTRIGRGSFYETRHHLRRASRRNRRSAEQIEQLQPILQGLGPRLNANIRMLARRAKQSASTRRPR